MLKAIPEYFNKSGFTVNFPLEAAVLIFLLLLLSELFSPSDVVPKVVETTFSYKYISFGENCIINTANAPIDIPNDLNICKVLGSDAKT